MPWNLLLLPLLGGYYFCTRCYLAKYKYRRSDGNRLLLAAALHGLVFLLVASIIVFVASAIFRSWPTEVASWWQQHVPFPHFGKAFLALAAAVSFTHLANLFVDEAGQKLKVVTEEGDVLENILQVAFGQTKPLLISLKTGKVYVCMTLDGFQPSLDRKYLSVLPLWSGFRTKETQEVRFTTDYTKVYLELLPDQLEILDDFELAIPSDQIAAITFFDRTLYQDHFQHREVAPAGAEPAISTVS